MKFSLLINMKIPTIVGIFVFFAEKKHEIFSANKYKFSLLINMKIPKIVGIFVFICREKNMKFSLLINMKMPTIVGIFIFFSRENSILSWVKHEKVFLIRSLMLRFCSVPVWFNQWFILSFGFQCLRYLLWIPNLVSSRYFIWFSCFSVILGSHFATKQNTFCQYVLQLSYQLMWLNILNWCVYIRTVKPRWLEHRWLVYLGWFELVFELLRNSSDN